MILPSFLLKNELIIRKLLTNNAFYLICMIIEWCTRLWAALHGSTLHNNYGYDLLY
jgi:hypothetical protein